MSHPLEDLYGPIIHSYTRAQALQDGALIVVPNTLAAEAGFNLPIAITAAAWDAFVAWDSASEKAIQDEQGRLWDVLWMTRHACVQPDAALKDTVRVEFMCVPPGSRTGKPIRSFLKAVIGPGDDAEPVMTLMLTCED